MGSRRNHPSLSSLTKGLCGCSPYYGRRQLRSASTATTATPLNTATPPPSPVPPPSWKDLRWVALSTGIPFIGFGFMDNAILIIAGDAIDTSLGVMLGISTLCAAAIGNIISDLAGIGLGAWIEDFCANTLKLPTPTLTQAQRQLRSVRLASQGGMAIGMTMGCIIGMFPLLFMDSVHKTEQLRRRAELEALFKDVVTDAKTLVGAESTCLYLRVDDFDDDNDVKNHRRNNATDDDDEKSPSKFELPWYRRRWWFGGGGGGSTAGRGGSGSKGGGISMLPYRPSVNGEYLYSMYYPIVTLPPKGVVHNGEIVVATGKYQHQQQYDVVTEPRLVPVGRGIVSRAVLTGDTWNIAHVNREPDFYPPPLPSSQAVVETATATDGTESTTTSSTIGALEQPSSSHHHHHPERVPRPEYRNLVVVPILDGQGRVIAVIEARNKMGDEEEGGGRGSNEASSSSSSTTPTTPFTDQDVEILKSLASHISVSLQLTYQVAEEGEDRGRLKDTIRIMKEIGIQGTEAQQHRRRFFSQPYRRGPGGRDGPPSLFPPSSTSSSSSSSSLKATPPIPSPARSPPSPRRLARSKSKLFPDEASE